MRNRLLLRIICWRISISLRRDFRRLLGVWEGADMMPLGAGAIAGTTFPIDRFMVAEELNFGTVYPNSMDAVSDRDYIIEFFYPLLLC